MRFIKVINIKSAMKIPINMLILGKEVLSLSIHPLVSTKNIEFIAKTFQESL
jgi:hypothetical protein